MSTAGAIPIGDDSAVLHSTYKLGAVSRDVNRNVRGQRKCRRGTAFRMHTPSLTFVLIKRPAGIMKVRRHYAMKKY